MLGFLKGQQESIKQLQEGINQYKKNAETQEEKDAIENALNTQFKSAGVSSFDEINEMITKTMEQVNK